MTSAGHDGSSVACGMVHHPPYSPLRDLCTENLHVGVSFYLKRALTDAARREGKSVASVVREAVEEAIERGRTTRPAKR